MAILIALTLHIYILVIECRHIANRNVLIFPETMKNNKQNDIENERSKNRRKEKTNTNFNAITRLSLIFTHRDKVEAYVEQTTRKKKEAFKPIGKRRICVHTSRIYVSIASVFNVKLFEIKRKRNTRLKQKDEQKLDREKPPRQINFQFQGYCLK